MYAPALCTPPPLARTDAHAQARTQAYLRTRMHAFAHARPTPTSSTVRPSSAALISSAVHPSITSAAAGQIRTIKCIGLGAVAGQLVLRVAASSRESRWRARLAGRLRMQARGSAAPRAARRRGRARRRGCEGGTRRRTRGRARAARALGAARRLTCIVGGAALGDPLALQMLLQILRARAARDPIVFARRSARGGTHVALGRARPAPGPRGRRAAAGFAQPARFNRC